MFWCSTILFVLGKGFALIAACNIHPNLRKPVYRVQTFRISFDGTAAIETFKCFQHCSIQAAPPSCNELLVRNVQFADIALTFALLDLFCKPKQIFTNCANQFLGRPSSERIKSRPTSIDPYRYIPGYCAGKCVLSKNFSSIDIDNRTENFVYGKIRISISV